MPVPMPCLWPCAVPCGTALLAHALSIAEALSLPSPPVASVRKHNGTEREEACDVRVSPDRQGEPAPRSKTIDCASSRRLASLASANMACTDAASAYE